MCQQCAALVSQYLSNETEEEVDFILWERTPFPFGGPADLEKALQAFVAQRKDGKHGD